MRWTLPALLAALVVAAPAPAAADMGDGMTVESTYGHMPEEQVTALLNARMPDITRCFREVSERQWFLSGTLELKGRVGADGSVKSLAVLTSTVGSSQVERCVLGVLRTLKLPAPQGGDGEFICPVEFKASERARSVQAWSDERVAADMARHRGEVVTCLRSGDGIKKVRKAMSDFFLLSYYRPRITLYIGPGGRVATAGFSADEPVEDRVAACLLARVATWQLPDPLGQLAKAGHTFK